MLATTESYSREYREYQGSKLGNEILRSSPKGTQSKERAMSQREMLVEKEAYRQWRK